MRFRRFVYHSVSTLFFILLVLTAWSITATLTFSKPDRLESWLSQSKLYDHFVATAIEQLQKSTDSPSNHSADNGLSLSLSDPGVQDATKKAFTPQVLENAVNTFLDGNYNWLNGKTATPDFKIDFTAAKLALGGNIGSYVQTKLGSLPKCTTPVVVDENFDALSATCLPAGVDPVAEGQKAQQQIVTSQGFLANPVITQQTLNENKEQGSQPSQPYYEKLSQLPQAYRAATKLPWLLGLLAVLSGVGVVYLASSKRFGWRRIGTLLISSGAVILLLILVSGAAVSAIEHRVFANTPEGQLQKSLVDFAHRAHSSLIKIDLWFGIGFILAGIIVYLLLKFVWPSAPKPEEPSAAQTPTAPKVAPKAPNLIQL